MTWRAAIGGDVAGEPFRVRRVVMTCRAAIGGDVAGDLSGSGGSQ